MTTQAPPAPAFRSVLRRPDFRWLALGLGLSTMGVFAYHVALYALVWEATGSAAWAAATTLGRFVPSLLFSSYGGVLAERFERRRLLIFTDAVSLLIMLGLALVGGLGLSVVLAVVLAGRPEELVVALALVELVPVAGPASPVAALPEHEGEPQIQATG
jgi:MFS family permease